MAGHVGISWPLCGSAFVEKTPFDLLAMPCRQRGGKMVVDGFPHRLVKQHYIIITKLSTEMKKSCIFVTKLKSDHQVEAGG